MHTILITGAGGFIGSNVLQRWLRTTDYKFVLMDSFRHKGTYSRLNEVIVTKEDHERCKVVHCNLNVPVDPFMGYKLLDYNIDFIVNFASDSSVAHSVMNPATVWDNNTGIIINMLELYRFMFKARGCVFIQIGTDEVYGEYDGDGIGHKEWDCIVPSNVYAASKAAQENLCHAYWRTFDLPIILTNTMNNFGYMQDPEKFIPAVVKRFLSNEEVSVYTDENGVPGSRVYLHTYDHADALEWLMLMGGFFSRNRAYCFGENGLYFNNDTVTENMPRYNVCGEGEWNNLQVVEEIAAIMKVTPKIKMVKPNVVRPGYDKRYLLDGTKMARMGFRPKADFKQRLREVVEWTVSHPEFLAKFDYAAA